MILFDLVIPGAPVPKGRPRSTRAGITYTPAKTREAEARIRALALDGVRKLGRQERLQCAAPAPLFIAGPVAVNMHFVFPLPKSLSKAEAAARLAVGWHCHRPDKDNLEKLVLDALNGILYFDDTQVVSTCSLKYWASTEDKHPAGYTWVQAWVPPARA